VNSEFAWHFTERKWSARHFCHGHCMRDLKSSRLWRFKSWSCG